MKKKNRELRLGEELDYFYSRYLAFLQNEWEKNQPTTTREEYMEVLLTQAAICLGVLDDLIEEVESKNFNGKE